MYHYLTEKKLPDIIQEDVTIGYLAQVLDIQKNNYSIPTEWYDLTPFSVHPCSLPLFAILSTKPTFMERVEILGKMLLLNNYYQKHFDLK